GLEEVPRDGAVENALDLMAADPGLVQRLAPRQRGRIAGVHTVVPEPPLADAAHHLQPSVGELQAIIQGREARLDFGRGDHVLGQLVPDGFDADSGVAHGWVVRGYGRQAWRKGQATWRRGL